jgi:hypothetical protein
VFIYKIFICICLYMIHTRWDKYGRAMTENLNGNRRDISRWDLWGLSRSIPLGFPKHNFSLHFFPKYITFFPFGNCYPVGSNHSVVPRVKNTNTNDTADRTPAWTFLFISSTTLGTKGSRLTDAQRMYTARYSS